MKFLSYCSIFCLLVASRQASESVLSSRVCPAKICALNKTEIGRWECLGDHLFGQPPEHGRYVMHSCGGLGWGNGMYSMMIAAQLAAILDARLVFERDLTNLWELPRSYYEFNRGYVREYWNYSKYGRHEKDFTAWVDQVYSSESFVQKYNHKVVSTGICVMDSKIIKLGRCLAEAIPVFAKCLHQLDDIAINIPIYYLTFRKPTQTMVDHLARIRKRLSLPPLPAGLEPNPGAWGLFTPGYYLLALHFRMVPLGFEPLSVMLNDEEQLRRKLADLRNFWRHARKLAGQAADLARCRNETLLIYLATDDPTNLRGPAQRKLGKFGRVVFGLEEDEVGHMSPQWTPTTEREVDQAVEALRQKQRRRVEASAAATPASTAAAADAGGSQACGQGDQACAASSGGDSGGEWAHVGQPRRGREATREHRDAALVEWWVLANAQWLVTTRYSSFSSTAAAWGLGPGGRTERVEVHGRPVFRMDWAGAGAGAAGPGACPRVVGAADPEQAARCPNVDRP